MVMRLFTRVLEHSVNFISYRQILSISISINREQTRRVIRHLFDFILSKIKKQPKIIIADFEITTIISLKKKIFNSHISLCFFSFFSKYVNKNTKKWSSKKI